MFSKRMLIIIAVIMFIALSIVLLSITARRQSVSVESEKIPVAIVGPLQGMATYSIRAVRDVWKHYFYLVSAAKENDRLKKELSIAKEINNRCIETKLSNVRLRNFLNFQKEETRKMVAAEVIGKDSSAWYKSIIIDKGTGDGVQKGYPVVIPEGIVGQVVIAAKHYAKVSLIIDINSAVDALIQRSRARGIIKGTTSERCFFNYVLWKDDIGVGDTVVSSGLDGVYPKGLRIGYVASVVKRNSGIFQEVEVVPYVDFEKLEEILVIINSPLYEFTSE